MATRVDEQTQRERAAQFFNLVLARLSTEKPDLLEDAAEIIKLHREQQPGYTKVGTTMQQLCLLLGKAYYSALFNGFVDATRAAARARKSHQSSPVGGGGKELYVRRQQAARQQQQQNGAQPEAARSMIASGKPGEVIDLTIGTDEGDTGDSGVMPMSNAPPPSAATATRMVVSTQSGSAIAQAPVLKPSFLAKSTTNAPERQQQPTQGGRPLLGASAFDPVLATNWGPKVDTSPENKLECAPDGGPISPWYQDQLLSTRSLEREAKARSFGKSPAKMSAVAAAAVAAYHGRPFAGVPLAGKQQQEEQRTTKEEAAIVAAAVAAYNSDQFSGRSPSGKQPRRFASPARKPPSPATAAEAKSGRHFSFLIRLQTRVKDDTSRNMVYIHNTLANLQKSDPGLYHQALGILQESLHKSDNHESGYEFVANVVYQKLKALVLLGDSTVVRQNKLFSPKATNGTTGFIFQGTQRQLEDTATAREIAWDEFVQTQIPIKGQDRVNASIGSPLQQNEGMASGHTKPSFIPPPQLAHAKKNDKQKKEAPSKQLQPQQLKKKEIDSVKTSGSKKTVKDEKKHSPCPSNRRPVKKRTFSYRPSSPTPPLKGVSSLDYSPSSSCPSPPRSSPFSPRSPSYSPTSSSASERSCSRPPHESSSLPLQVRRHELPDVVVTRPRNQSLTTNSSTVARRTKRPWSSSSSSSEFSRKTPPSCRSSRNSNSSSSSGMSVEHTFGKLSTDSTRSRQAFKRRKKTMARNTSIVGAKSNSRKKRKIQKMKGATTTKSAKAEPSVPEKKAREEEKISLLEDRMSPMSMAEVSAVDGLCKLQGGDATAEDSDTASEGEIVI